MVGFGSSLRLARRAGWEGAYLDYESLKLLLSQIEAVYEEEGHSRMSRENSVRDTLWDDAEILYEQPAGGGRHRRHHHHRPSGGKRPTGHRAAATARDYKDELFLESDSEAAFLSIDEEDYTTTDDDDDDDKQVDNYINKQHATKPFLLSYSHEHPSSSEEGDKKGNDALCWGGGKSGDTAGSNGSKQKSVKKRRKKRATLPSIISEKEEGSFYSVTAGAAANTFYMAGGDDDVAKTPVAANLPTSSNDYNASLQFFPTAESTALLPATRTSSSPSSLFTFTSATGESLTPPSWNMYPRQSKTTNISTFHNHSRAPGGLAESTPILLGDSFTSPRPSLVQPAPLYQQFQNQQRVSANYEKPERRRKRERNVRRVHRQKLRAQRERKVPRHLRLAHAKARAITERFLGLLRAETEKVLLFAQSRLGELADTAGSLRFPSFDEEYASNAYNYSQPPQSDPQPLHGHHHHSNNNNNNTNSDSRAHCGAGTYEFGDGGMHPSASSSSDDGTGGGGLGGGRPWTDSSDEEEDNSNAINGKTANASLQMSGEQTTRSRTQSIRGGLKAASAMMMTMPKSFSGALSDDTPTNVTARTKDMEKLQKVRRQITHFTALRKRRAVFQRNEQILGEDLLFLPAVEETDGYTAVGVELMHVLKYICVNLIAVRKICRKHDRLLMNRMLGGYYQRIRTRGDVQNSYSHNIEGVTTLGGMVARISGDIYEAHPALIGQMNHYKLIGVYDKKIQKLANSRTVQVVSSCLALSLSEYELARSRAAALTRLNSAASFQNSDSQMRFGGDAAAADGESADDPPSTASIISLTRLRYTVMSIFALREVSRSKMDHFMTYLARATLSFTGHPVVGEGFDGCSRETLDFIVSYDPDAALLRDSSLLFDGLKQNRWSHLPLSDVMVSTLAAATSPVNVAPEVASAFLSREERIVAHAVSAVPEWKVFMWKGLINGHFPKMTRRRTVAVTEIPPVALRLNRMSLLLYSMNYFMSHATTSIFVKAAGAPSAYSAIIIGAPNLSAILIAVFHCWLASREPLTGCQCRFHTKGIRWLMIFGSTMGVVGNAMHATAVDKSSLMMSVGGRFCMGFSAAEILQREIMAACIPAHVVSESARLLMSRIFGVASGLLIGAASAVPIAVERMGVGIAYSPHARQLQASSWVMMILWLIHLLRVLVQLRDQTNIPDSTRDSPVDTEEQATGGETERVTSRDSDSDASSSADIVTPSSVLYRSSSEITHVDPITTAFGGEHRSDNEIYFTDESTALRRDEDRVPIQNRPASRQWKTLGRILKLFSFHVGIPISLLVFFYVTFASEIFFTVTPLITDRYFGWSGARAGTFLGCLAILVLPNVFICEIVARRYEERSILKRSLGILCFGFLILMNWESVFSVATRASKLFADTNGRPSHPYDWKCGVFQYVIGLMIVFSGLTALEGATLSLLSKVSPINTRSIVINVGTMTTFLGLLARLLGDFDIVMVDLSHKVINTDIINSLVLPLLLASLLLSYLVGKNFFFLM